MQKLKAFAYLVFPNSPLTVIPKVPLSKEQPIEQGIITSVTHGAMPGTQLLVNLDISSLKVSVYQSCAFPKTLMTPFFQKHLHVFHWKLV